MLMIKILNRNDYIYTYKFGVIEIAILFLSCWFHAHTIDIEHRRGRDREQERNKAGEEKSQM